MCDKGLAQAALAGVRRYLKISTVLAGRGSKHAIISE
jgi:hypothetical protein